MVGTLFRDVVFILALTFAVLVAIILPWINPPTEEAKADPPGNLLVMITWPEGDTDVDLWVTGPGEMVPVGYSNKGGLLFNLLRDDLGKHPDATPLNYENAYTRGIVAGEYRINVHCFRCPVLPVPVTVEVSLNTGEPGKTSIKQLVATKVTLDRNGEEKTAIRFLLDGKGNVVPDSMNRVYKPLRSAEKP